MKVSKLMMIVLSVIVLMACKREGCTDQNADNYDKNAKNDDGSCVYNGVNPNDPNNPGGGTTGPGGQELPIRLSGKETSNLVIEDISSDPNVVEYYIDDNWRIAADVVIEPGVRIEMRQDAYILVESNGSLDATGTPNDKIQILGGDDVKGHWKYIKYESNETNNKLIHCNIAHGGGAWNAQGMVTVQGSANLTVQNSSFTMGKEYGLFVSHREGKLPDFKDNYFDAFEKQPISLHTFGQSGTLDNTTTFGSNNDMNDIRVHGDNYSNSVNVPKLNLPYYLANVFEITGGHTSFSPGVTLIMGQDTRIIASDQGSLSLDGTVTDSVRVYGASGIPGYWQSIVLESMKTENEFSYTTFNYGGGAWNNDAMIYIRGGALAMNNCYIKNGSKKALNKDNNGVFNDNGGNMHSDCQEGGGLLP
ncbi:hypothetical protein [Brumimicrobium salinarum]|nr:hypothetical protein [Brumimicrobium salinarum]